MVRYNPVSYHNGSVWPHDSAIATAGLMRYGRVEEAYRLIGGLLDAAAAFDGRLPELFAGFDRSELSTPAVYPTSCSPQAWAAAAPLLLVRALLRLDPWKSRSRVYIARRLDIDLDDDRFGVEGLDGLELDTSPRPPLSRAFDPGV